MRKWGTKRSTFGTTMGREWEVPPPPTPVTTIDMDVIIRGWEEKFEHLSRCLRDVQLASEKANSDMCDVNREGRARGIEQERRLQAMHVGITDFLQKCEPTHLSATRQDNAPTASTPYAQSTPTGIPARLRPEFDFHPSPVSQDELMEPARSTISHVRDHDDNRSTRTRDHELMEPARSTISHVRDHNDNRSTRTRDHELMEPARSTISHVRDHDDVFEGCLIFLIFINISSIIINILLIFNDKFDFFLNISCVCVYYFAIM